MPNSETGVSVRPRFSYKTTKIIISSDSSSSDMFALTAGLTALASADLARPGTEASTRLSASPNIWLTHDFLSSSAVAHLRSKVPTEEAAYTPCIGQVHEFD